VVLDKDTVVMMHMAVEEIKAETKEEITVEAIVWETKVKKDLLVVCQIKQEVIYRR
jgi:hypothetical protein